MNTHRMEYFALTFLLKAICDPESLHQLAIIYEAQADGQKRAGLLLGYKLVIETLLYRHLEMTIQLPEILGLKLDDDLCRWWMNSETKSRKDFKVALCGDTANSTLVANYINALLTQVVQCGPRLEPFQLAAEKVFSFTHTILSMTENCRLTVRKGSNKHQELDMVQALRLCGVDYLYGLFYVGDHDVVNRVYDYTRPESVKWEEGNILEDFEMFELVTSRDVIGVKPPIRRNSPKYLASGINVGVAMAMYKMDMQGRLVYGGEDEIPPARDLYGKMFDEFEQGLYPSVEYGLEIRNGFPREKLESIMLSDSSVKLPLERLIDLFGETAYLASSLSSNAEFHFEVLIRGALACGLERKEFEVLQINHAGSPDERHPPVSLAIRIGSDWQVFYYIDAVGRMKSPLWNLLDGLGITSEKIEGISTQDLLRLCDRPFHYVNKRLKEQNDLNSSLRGEIPELLACLLLVHSGYHPVRKSIEPAGIGEFDASGFKMSDEGGTCKLVEVKKKSTDQNELRDELEKFARKLDQAKLDRGALEKELRCPSPIRRVSGLFITMADVGEIPTRLSVNSEPFFGLFSSSQAQAEFKALLDSRSDIEFWDYNRFKSELTAADVPERPIRLLEDKNMRWELTDRHTGEPTDIWDMLSKAAMDDDRQWPGSLDALVTKLRDEPPHVS